MTDSPSFSRIAVFGAGTMGHGIAQVSAQAGYEVVRWDMKPELVDAGLGRIAKNLRKGIEKGKVTEAEAEETLSRLSGTDDLVLAADGAGLLVEAIPEQLQWKQDLFSKLGQLSEPGAIYATNTSSISIAELAKAAPEPSRVIGTHFFNPVFIMKLLEIVHHPGTDAEVIRSVQAYGERIGKECILVRDSPGFATSRLGVCLGMEAIRMVQEGVASPEDIDTGMVLGYRHPIGPLRLTDLVGLDVRMHIGEYLAKALDNPAFEPPDLMRQMVADGKLGQKSGAGFYSW